MTTPQIGFISVEDDGLTTYLEATDVGPEFVDLIYDGTIGQVGPTGPAGATGSVGPTGPAGATLNFRSTWTTATNYAVLDVVSDGGAVYRCYVAHTSSATTEPGVGATYSSVWAIMVPYNLPPTGSITSAMIADGTIVNADINAAAAIALSKLATDPLARANHTGTQSADTLTDGTTNKAFLATERTKLTGIATGATANSSDAVLEARANHTGTQLAATISDFNTAVRLNRVDQLAAIGNDLPFAGFRAYNLGAWTLADDAITPHYLHRAFTARVATTANITLSGTQTIDGVAVAAGDTVLVKAQTTAADNLVYFVTAGAWTVHPISFYASFSAQVINVSEGTLNADTSWMLTTNGASGTGQVATATAKVWTQIAMAFPISAAAIPNTYPQSTLIPATWEPFPRDCAGFANNIPATGTIRYRYFTADKSGSSTALTYVVNQIQVGFTFTVIQWGLYSLDASSNITLLVSTANTITALNTAGPISINWASSQALAMGTRYAVGMLVVFTGSGTTPNLIGGSMEQVSLAVAPRLTGFQSGQASLPSTVTNAAMSTTFASYYYRLT